MSLRWATFVQHLRRFYAHPISARSAAAWAVNSAPAALEVPASEKGVTPMKVRDVMTKGPAFCQPDTTVSAATELMWKSGCGFLPVIGEGGNVISVVTDRDISIALGIGNRRPSQLLVKDIMGRKLFTCTAEDSVHTALATMRVEGLRRLPVVDAEGALAGVLSIDDLVRKAHEQAFRQDVSYQDVEDTYKAISRHAVRAYNGGRAAA